MLSKALMIITFLVICLLSYSNSQTKLNSGLDIQGKSTINSLEAESLQVEKSIKISESLESNTLTTNDLTSTIASIEIIQPKDKVLVIDGNVIMSNDLLASEIDLQTSSFSLEGIKQWKLIRHEDFENDEQVKGWSDPRINRCHDSNAFLGGHCHFAGNEVSKVFDDLPKHKKIRITGLFHMFDSWEGEMGYMKIEGKTVWSKRAYNQKGGISLCGGDHGDLLSQPIDVVIDHEGDKLKITFGSTLDEDPCNESFGIDDIALFIK